MLVLTTRQSGVGKDVQMKLLSLFSGIGAFEKALEKLNINYELAGYCEFDKYASKSYAAIHGVDESMNLGDITKVDEKVLPKDINLITYGFPCQDISLAGKQKGLFNEDGSQTRSGLFFEALRIIEEVKPEIAIAENVKNLVSKKFSEQFNIVLESLVEAGYNNYWKVLNAKDYGIPQNRERVFIVSIRKDIDPGTFEFPKPFKLKLRLKDMLEDELDEKYFLSEKMIKYVLDVNDVQKGTKWEGRADEDILNPNIAHTLSVRGAGGNQRAGVSNFIVDGLDDEIKVKDLKEKILIKENTKKGYAEARDGDGVYINRPHQKRGVVQKGMIPTLKTSPNDVGVVVKDKINVIGNYSPSEHNASRIVHPDGIAPTVVEHHGTVTAIVIGSTQKNAYVGSINSVCPTLTAAMGKGGGHIPMITTRLRIRKLTPKECFRLMGFTDEDFEKAQAVPTSDTQLYKQAGNSIVVDVLVHLYNEIFKVIKIISEEKEMAKENEYKLIMVEMNKMFNLEKLIQKEPELVQELIKKYPLKKCVYLIRNKNEEEQPVVEEVVQEEAEELAVESVPVIDDESRPVEFPEDFQPLYKIGEEITVHYDYGAKVEDIKITDIKLEYVNSEPRYYYQYVIAATGEVKTMAEPWLTEHEVLD